MRGKWDLLPGRPDARNQWDIVSGASRRLPRRHVAFGLTLVLLIAVAVTAAPSGGSSGGTSIAAGAPPAVAVASGSPTASGSDAGTVGLAADDQAPRVPSESPSVSSAPAPAPASQVAAGPKAPAGEPPTPPSQPPKADDIPGEWIVELQPGQSSEQVASDHEANDGAEVHQVYGAAVDGYAAGMTDEEAQHVAADPRVASVTRDRMVYATAETVPTGIRRIGAAPSASPGPDVNVDVAVVDTGISANADLNIVGGKNCNGYGTSYADGYGHGTHVAGTIGARNQDSGVVGVAPGARLWAVRVLDNNGSGSWSQIVCGLDWVRAQGNIEVVNMSLGGSGTAGSSCSSSTLRNAICNLVNAGVTVAVAAGNDHANVSGSVPAAFPEAITVSALADFNGLAGGGAAATCRSDVDDTFADFSNYGAGVDVIAPGVCITSTSRSGGTEVMSGTSMATPHVAGAAALLKAANPGFTPAQVLSTLIANGNSNWNGAGDPDGIHEPLISVGPPPPPPAQVPPTANFTSSCSGLTCTFTNTSTDANGDAMSYVWDFGDSTPTTTTVSPVHPYGAAGNYTVTLTATDNDGPNSISKTASPTNAPPISLTVTRTSSWWSGTYATLKWSGASGSTVDIWRRPSTGTFTKILAGTSNDGTQTNSPGAGTWVYKVCLLNNATACSNEATVTI